MELVDAVKQRVSVRDYLGKEVSLDLLKELVYAAMEAPSGKNLRPLRFVIITEKGTLEKVKTSSPYSQYNAPAAILVVADTVKSPSLWVDDGDAATEHILLRAVDLGLGTVWCGVHNVADRDQKIKEIIPHKEGEIFYSLILVGYPKEKKIKLGRVDESKLSIIA